MNINLQSTVSSNSNVEPEDTLTTKKALMQTGFMKRPAYGIDDMPDKPMIDGIKKLQQNHGLKVDGVMKPGGETEKKLQSLSSQVKEKQTQTQATSSRSPRHKQRIRKPEAPNETGGKSLWSDPIGYVSDYVDIVYGDNPAGISNDPDADYGYYKPDNHDYVVGREELEKHHLNPGGSLMKPLEDYWPGMHTTGVIHDEVVDRMTGRGWSDSAANTPTMYPSYVEAQRRELLNKLSKIFNGDEPAPYRHKAKGGRFE